MIDMFIPASLVGWSYFILLSFSFYPQFWTNYKLGHVKGYSPDFSFLSLSGFTFYFLHCTWGYFDPDKVSGAINIQDLAYASHTWLLTVLLLCQCLYYDGKFLNHLQGWVKVYVGLAWSLSITYCLFEAFGYSPNFTSTLNGCSLFGYLKIMIAFTKYFPQAIKNYTRKSTEGWNILTTLFELFGWILASVEIFIDSYFIEENGHLDVSKLVLGMVSIVFDLVFVIQHYVLYKYRSDIKLPLLPRGKGNVKSVSDIYQ